MADIQPTGLNVQNSGQSCKPPQVVSVPLDFSVNSSYVLNLKGLQDLGTFDALLSIFVDNRANAQALTVTMSGTLQTISCPAGKQGYFPVLSNNPPTLTFANGGGVLVNVFLMNFDISPAVWG